MSTPLRELQSEPSQDWKSKYQSLVGETERRERLWAEEESKLYRSVLRLLLSYSGKNARLDKSLGEMRKELRHIKDSQKRKSIISPVIDMVVQYAQSNEAEPSEKSEFQLLLLSLIDKVDLPIAARISADSIKRSLSDPTQNRRGAEQIESLAKLINESISEDRPHVDLKDDDPLLQLLQNLSFPGDLGAEIIGLRNRANELQNEQQRLEMIEELVTLLKSHTSTETSANPSAELSKYASILIELFEWLSIPSSHMPRVEKIVSQLSSLSVQSDIAGILRELALIINDLQAGLQEQLGQMQDFLAGITARLEEVENCFRNRISNDDENAHDATRLDENIKTELQKIRLGIEDPDPEGIKRMIETRIASIEENVSLYLESGFERQQKWKTEVDALNKQLGLMKVESIKLRKQVLKEFKKAQTDALTDIPNRLAYNEKLKFEFDRWQRYKQPFSICVIDVDKFKGVNDNYGHKAGDKVLKTISQVCAGKVRKSDFFARYGGEEFVLLMPETSVGQAETVANNLRKDVHSCKFHHAGKPVPITISCGIAEVKSSDSPDQLFRRAGAALYNAKQNGRNRVELA